MLLNMGPLRTLIRSTTNKNLMNQTFKLLSTSANESATNANEAKPQSGEATPKPDANLENELKALQEKLAKQEAETSDYKDKHLRALAEAENTRIRMRKEVDNAKIFGIQGFCKDLLEVADVLSLAIENTNPNKNQNSDDQSKTDPKEQLNAMYKGLVMTETCLLKIFEKHGLVQIKPQSGMFLV